MTKTAIGVYSVEVGGADVKVHAMSGAVINPQGRRGIDSSVLRPHGGAQVPFPSQAPWRD